MTNALNYGLISIETKNARKVLFTFIQHKLNLDMIQFCSRVSMKFMALVQEKIFHLENQIYITLINKYEL
jgi:hypothetical protein